MDAAKNLLFLSAAQGSGGGEYFAREFLRSLSARGWRVTVVATAGAPLLRDAASLGARGLPCDLAAQPAGRPAAFLRTAIGWTAIAARHRGALVYANGFECMKWAALSASLLGRPAVCHLHESIHSPYATRRARLAARPIRRFIAISREVRDRFVEGAHVEPERVALIYNGIPIGASPEAGPDEAVAVRRLYGFDAEAPLVTLVARTDPHKGHDVFLRAAVRIRAAVPRARFLIAGLQNLSPEEAGLFDHITGLIRALGLDDAIRHTGHTPDARRLMRASDVVTVPSTAEGFGRTAIEAMAEGAAVVASRVGGLADILTDGEDGLYVPPGDSEALAARVIALLADPARRARLAAAGRQTAVRRFSLPAMVDAIETLLVSVVSTAAGV